MSAQTPFHDLDWPKLLTHTEEEARTPYGKRNLEVLAEPGAFSSTMERAQELQHETQEMAQILERSALWGPLNDLQDIDEDLENLERGSVLELHAWVRIRAWLHAMDSWSHFPKELAGKNFKNALQNLFDPFECLRVLDRVITPAGELSEKASPKLGTLYATARELRREIEKKIDSLLRDYGSKGLLQENYSDVRDGRYVLPVRVSDQSKIDGRVAEFSVSKQTVFIEPKEVEELQSRLRRTEADLSHEIFVILMGLARQLQPHGPSIGASVQLIGYWDATQAKARIAKRYGGRLITLSPDREWILQETVDPILFWNLPEEQIVRNTIELRSGQQMILLSGPNTGGKTVLLKTLGLSALCARSGFFFPAAGKLRVPFFDSFFVDLGDPQSIEEHISSFSGHVLKMKRILEGVGPKSLILVDEMNSATDPEEGAALAMAFVQTLLKIEGAILIATTHDPKLKAMGLADSRVLDASILFDEASLKPTYRVVFGAPGRSRALETAERLGLPKELLELARSYLSKEHKIVESVLQQLQAQLGSVERAEREARALRDEADRLKAEWEERVKTTVNESLEKARQKLKHVLDLAQVEVRETLKKIQSTKTHKQLDDLRRELNDAFQAGERRLDSSIKEAAPELMEAVSNEAEIPSVSVQFEKGQWVRVPKWKNVGELVEWDGKKGRVALGAQSGAGLGKAFVVSVYPVEIEPLSERELRAVLGVRAGSAGVKAAKVTVQDPGGVPDQIDVRGQRLDETLREVGNFLDRACRAGKPEVTIVHGLGTGALREGIREMLKKLNYVSAVEDAGTTGATRVRF